jgi:hypothetical protein
MLCHDFHLLLLLCEYERCFTFTGAFNLFGRGCSFHLFTCSFNIWWLCKLYVLRLPLVSWIQQWASPLSIAGTGILWRGTQHDTRCIYVKFYWNTVMRICLCCFWATRAELRRCNRDCGACKAKSIYYLSLRDKSANIWFPGFYGNAYLFPTYFPYCFLC